MSALNASSLNQDYSSLLKQRQVLEKIAIGPGMILSELQCVARYETDVAVLYRERTNSYAKFAGILTMPTPQKIEALHLSTLGTKAEQS